MTLKEVLTFQKEKEKAFQNFFYKQDLKICRAAIVLVITIMLVLEVIDYNRLNNFSWVLISRMIVIIGLSALLIITYQRKVKADQLQFWLMFINFIMVFSFFFMDATTIMPSFYLTNSLVVYFFISGTVSGARFRHSSSFNLLVIIYFLFYCQTSYNAAFQQTQIPNLVISFCVSLLISFMWEWYKRVNFLQQNQLNNLINIFSHDMVSPLNSLLGLLSLHDDRLLNQSEFNTHVGLIKKSTFSNILLLQNLVKWSKSQMNGFSPNFEPIDLQLIVADAINLLQNAASEKEIIIETRFNNNTTCYADLEMTKLIVRNTLSNAIKFSHLKSKIELETENDHHWVRLKIKDYGIGMTQDEIDHLFSMTIGSKPGTANERGTGIGLYMTREFVELNKGEIQVESKKGNGSLFKISFPKHKHS